MAAVTDPVCGMQIESSEAAAQSQHQGRVFYFCSRECKQKFDADPARYANAAGMAGQTAGREGISAGEG